MESITCNVGSQLTTQLQNMEDFQKNKSIPMTLVTKFMGILNGSQCIHWSKSNDVAIVTCDFISILQPDVLLSSISSSLNCWNPSDCRNFLQSSSSKGCSVLNVCIKTFELTYLPPIINHGILCGTNTRVSLETEEIVSLDFVVCAIQYGDTLASLDSFFLSSSYNIGYSATRHNNELRHTTVGNVSDLEQERRLHSDKKKKDVRNIPTSRTERAKKRAKKQAKKQLSTNKIEQETDVSDNTSSDSCRLNMKATNGTPQDLRQTTRGKQRVLPSEKDPVEIHCDNAMIVTDTVESINCRKQTRKSKSDRLYETIENGSIDSIETLTNCKKNVKNKKDIVSDTVLIDTNDDAEYIEADASFTKWSNSIPSSRTRDSSIGLQLLSALSSIQAHKTENKFCGFAWCPRLFNCREQCLFVAASSNGAVQLRSLIKNKRSSTLLFNFTNELLRRYQGWLFYFGKGTTTANNPSSSHLKLAHSYCYYDPKIVSSYFDANTMAFENSHKKNIAFGVTRDILLMRFQRMPPNSSSSNDPTVFKSNSQSLFSWMHQMGCLGLCKPCVAFSPNSLLLPSIQTPPQSLYSGVICVITFHSVATIWWIESHTAYSNKNNITSDTTNENSLIVAPDQLQVYCLGAVDLPSFKLSSDQNPNKKNGVSDTEPSSIMDYITAISLSPLCHDRTTNNDIVFILYIGTSNGQLLLYQMRFQKHKKKIPCPKPYQPDHHELFYLRISSVEYKSQPFLYNSSIEFLETCVCNPLKIVENLNEFGSNCNQQYWVLTLHYGTDVKAFICFMKNYQLSDTDNQIIFIHKQTILLNQSPHSSSITGCRCLSSLGSSNIKISNNPNLKSMVIARVYSIDCEGLLTCWEITIQDTTQESHNQLVTLGIVWLGIWDNDQFIQRDISCDTEFNDQQCQLSIKDKTTCETNQQNDHLLFNKYHYLKTPVPQSIRTLCDSVIPRIRGLGLSPSSWYQFILRDYTGSVSAAITGKLLTINSSLCPQILPLYCILNDMICLIINPLIQDVMLVYEWMTTQQFVEENFDPIIKYLVYFLSKRQTLRNPLQWWDIRQYFLNQQSLTQSLQSEIQMVLEDQNDNELPLPQQLLDEDVLPSFKQSQRVLDTIDYNYTEFKTILMEHLSASKSLIISQDISQMRESYSDMLISLLATTIHHIEWKWNHDVMSDMSQTTMDSFGTLLSFFIYRIGLLQQCHLKSSSCVSSTTYWTLSEQASLRHILLYITSCCNHIFKCIRKTESFIKQTKTTSIDTFLAHSVYKLLVSYTSLQFTRCLIALWTIIDHHVLETKERLYIWWILKKSLIVTMLRAAESCVPYIKTHHYSSFQLNKVEQLKQLVFSMETQGSVRKTCPYCLKDTTTDMPYTVFTCSSNHILPVCQIRMAPLLPNCVSFGCTLCGHMFTDLASSELSTTSLSVFDHPTTIVCPMCFGATKSFM